jgi:hypothetical protein
MIEEAPAHFLGQRPALRVDHAARHILLGAMSQSSFMPRP